MSPAWERNFFVYVRECVCITFLSDRAPDGDNEDTDDSED